MTKAVFFKKNDRIVRVECKGHTGYAEEGQDIVCAAVSAVMQSTALGVLKVAGINAKYEVDERQARLALRLPDDMNDKQKNDAETLLQTCLLSVKDIAADYKQFVVVEVRDL